MSLAAYVAVTFGLGVWGWQLADPHQPFLSDVYNTLQMFWIGGSFPPVTLPVQLEVARFLGALAFLAAVFLAFWGLFRAQIERWYIRRWRGHVIVCGLGSKGFEVVRALREAGERVVVVLLDAENDYLPAVRDLGAIGLIADATEEKALVSAGLRWASRLFVLCNDDRVNVAVAQMAARITAQARAGRRALECRVLINDEVWWQEFDSEKVTASDRTIAIEYFNVDERAADNLMLASPPPAFASREGPRTVRVAVIGERRFARAVAGCLVRHWRAGHPEAARLELQIWSGRAEEFEEDVRFEIHDDLDQGAAVDIHVIAEAAPLAEPTSTAAALHRAIKLAPAVDHIYVCLAMDHRVVATSLVIEEEIRARPGLAQGVTACLANAGEFGRGLLEGRVTRSGLVQVLSVFDIMAVLREPGFLVGGFHEKLARSIHEHYRSNHPEDQSSVPWDDLTEELREQNRQQALAFGYYLSKLGCVPTRRRMPGGEALHLSEADVDLIAPLEHARWRRSKEALHWRLGEKDNLSKKNPLLLDWESLTGDEQEITRLQVREMPAILSEAGVHVIRVASLQPAGTT